MLPDENQNNLPGYYKRYTPASGVKALLFRTTHALQVRECNDLQESIHDRIDGLANAIFADGDIASGLELVRLHDDPDGYDVSISAGEVFIQGHIYKMEEAKLDVPLDTKVALGLRMMEQVITDADDAGLRDPAQGTDNFDNPGANRLVRFLTWGWIADNNQTDGGSGSFFPVFTIDNGVPITRNLPPSFDAVVEHVAKYDYDAHGNYSVEGLDVSFMDDIGDDYHFNVKEGRGNIRGYKRNRLTSTRLIYEKDPDTRFANNEPHVFTPDGDGKCRIPVNRFPISSVGEIFGTKVKTETVIRGAYVGGIDQLSENAVLQVLQVKQGGTTYISGTDYTVAGDDINWSPLGAEPAPGSTYQVTYHYQAVVTPVEVTDTHIVLSGLVSGTYANIDYNYKLPRVDLITMNTSGELSRIKGESVERNPAPKHAPDGHLPLATIHFDWMNTPVVEDVRKPSVPYTELNEMKGQLSTLFDHVALLRLQLDIALTDPSSKHGVFVDSFRDDDLRDHGIEQTAVCIDGVLTLPFDAAIHAPDNVVNTAKPLMLPSVNETVIEQPNKTACMRINPYAAFDPLPAKVRLNPPVDRWIESGPDEFVSTVARNFVETWSSKGLLTSVSTQVSFQQIGLKVQPVQFMRQRQVQFIIDGFGPTEQVVEILFDNINVTHSVNGGNYVANSAGHVEGFFMIPPNVRTGARQVNFKGSGNTQGTATYVAEGQIVSRIMMQVNTTIVSHYDPLAQTFTLTEEDRIITGVDLKFCLLGDPTNKVFVQIRETQVGIPNDEVLAEGSVNPSSITLNVWKTVNFDLPVHLSQNREYAIVVLTDDKYHSVGIAKLGDYVTAGNGPREGWMTAQPYQIGALLASSNAKTWTPINEGDLTFRLKAARFTTNQTTIPLGNINGVNVTDMKPMATIVRPSADTQVDMLVNEATSGNQHRTPEDRNLRLTDRITDTFGIALDLRGTAKLSPIVYPYPQVLTGNMLNNGTYYGRAVDADVTFNATVTFSVLKSGSANIVPFIASQKMVSGSPEIIGGVYQEEFLAMTLTKQKPVGDGWVEETYSIAGAKGVGLDRYTRVHLALSGTPKFRVYGRELRAVIK